jgi:hypothetical protein
MRSLWNTNDTPVLIPSLVLLFAMAWMVGEGQYKTSINDGMVLLLLSSKERELVDLIFSLLLRYSTTFNSPFVAPIVLLNR